MRLVGSQILLGIVTSALGNAVHEPYRISLSDLLSEDFSEPFLDALTEVGIVAIKDIPGYASNKNQALSYLHSCNVESETREVSLKDGTVRRTLATKTVSGPGGAQKIFMNKKQEEIPPSCLKFVLSSNGLRSAVDSATKTFAKKLSLILQEDEAMMENPLLSSEDGSYDFENFEDIVEYGDHLEHFHSYQRDHPSKENEETIDVHTDQGLFIAFTPAMIASTSKEDKLTAAPGGGGFYIELKDSTRASVVFQPDDLIIMLGDGVNQILNMQKGGSNLTRKLRSTPHALIMPNYHEGEVRVWHGRMVLPPSGAVHPEHGKTFGQMRKLMIEASTYNKENANLRSQVEEGSLSIGCSSTSDSARLLEEEEVVCESGSIYCWHRCMPHADHNVTTEICASRNLNLQCINPRNQVYVEGHGDFYPACSNSTEMATDYPKLPTYPRDESVCDEASWNTFASTDGYEFVFDRLGDNQGQRGYWEGHENKGMGKVAKFMWNIVDDSPLVPRVTNVHQAIQNNSLVSKKIEGKVVFNGLFGYISIGFAKEGGKKNGMNGASVIMAIPGGNYTAMDGFDLSMGSSVHEYVIDLYGSSFRHWKDPIEGRDTSTYKVESTPCFTSLTFTTGDINYIPFNLEGSDKMIWAANNDDTYCGSHGRGQDGRGDRDAFMVEWKTGKAWFPVEIEEEENVEESDSSAVRKGVFEVVGLVSGVVAAFFVVL